MIQQKSSQHLVCMHGHTMPKKQLPLRCAENERTKQGGYLQSALLAAGTQGCCTQHLQSSAAHHPTDRFSFDRRTSGVVRGLSTVCTAPPQYSQAAQLQLCIPIQRPDCRACKHEKSSVRSLHTDDWTTHCQPQICFYDVFQQCQLHHVHGV